MKHSKVSNKLKVVKKHVKDDIKSFKKEIKEDKKLIRDIECKKCNKMHKKDYKHPKVHDKFEKVMHEFSEGKLHSSSKKGPIVKNKAQALAIGYSEARRSKKKK